MPGRDQAIAKGAKGVVRLLSYGDVLYNPWAPGKAYVMYADHVPSVAEIRKQGAVCTAGPNIVLLENGLQPPKWGDWLRGGTGSYGRIFTADKYPFDPNGWYPEYTLFVRPFTGNALIDQGHVLISLKAGKPKDVPAIQLDSFDGPGRPGLNTKRTVLRTHQLEAIAAAVPPEGWIR